MGVSTFNVREFNTIYTMIEENSNRVSTKTSKIVSLCEQLSQLVKSTDSNLSVSYVKIAEALTTAKMKVVSLLSNLEQEMKTYEAQTVENEETTAENIGKINEDIESVTAIFNGVANKKW